MSSGIDGFSGDLAQLGSYMADRVPVYQRAMALLGEMLDGDVGRRLAKAWSRRTFTAFYDWPLLLLATLRFDALREGKAHPLWSAIAADPPDPDALTAPALAAALDRDCQRAAVWHSLTKRSVQTNEVSRAVAWRWPAGLFAPAGAAVALCDSSAPAPGSTWWQTRRGSASPGPPVAPRWRSSQCASRSAAALTARRST